MLPAQTEERRRAEQLAGRVRQAVGDSVSARIASSRSGPEDEDADEVAVRRVSEISAALQLTPEESLDVLPNGERDGAGLGLERLDEHLAGRVPPVAARELRDELERALLRAKVGHTAAQAVGFDYFETINVACFRT